VLLSIHGDGTLSGNPKLEKENSDRVRLIKQYLVRMHNSAWAVARHAHKIAQFCVERDEGPVKGFVEPGAKPAPPIERQPVTLIPGIPACAQQYNEPIRDTLKQSKGDAMIDSPEIQRDADCIEESYERALEVLQTSQDDKPAVIALMVIDAYVTGVTADLIALISGQQKDKAIFLARMLDQFPHVDRFVTPGIVNAFYQLSDARVRTLGLWSLQQTLADLNYALHGADLLLTRSSNWLTHYSDGRPPPKLCEESPDVEKNRQNKDGKSDDQDKR
jgi:hypothetical protein